MRLIVGPLACLAFSAVLADEPPAATPASAKPAPAATAAAPSADVEAKQMRARGYRLEVRNGNSLWCRKEDTMGTRLGGHTVCRTAEQIRVDEEQAKRNVQQVQQSGPNKPAG